MSRYALDHLSDQTLLHDLATLVARDRTTTAELLAHIAEVDARKLYLPAAYPSVFAYCVGELLLSEDAAYKRIQAARVARRFPALFDAVADGRLHLTALGLLAPYLAPENADALLAAATHRSKAEIEQHLAERFPRSEAVAPERYLLQLTIDRGTRDKLSYAQELLAHHVPCGDIAQVFERALDALIPQLEQGRFAATARPRPGGHRPSTHPRHIPAHVKRAVWERDGGRCTFVSATGQRCPARTRLEFDHVLEVARGGEATVSGIRLGCRAHNQYEAERTFGSEFMRRKRLAAAEARAAAKVRADAPAPARTLTAPMPTAAMARTRPGAGEQPLDREQAVATEQARERDVVPWLRQLGFRSDEVRRGVELCAGHPPDASLEARVRLAVSSLGRGRRRRAVPGVGSSR